MKDPSGAIELVVTDLDGTLWEREGEVPERTRRALAAVVDGDVPLLVATGRRVVSTMEPLSVLGAPRRIPGTGRAVATTSVSATSST